MTDLDKRIRTLVPAVDFFSTCRIENHGDGRGAFIAHWDAAALGRSQPTDAELAAVVVPADYDHKQPREDAKALLAAGGREGKVLRAVVAVLLDEINALRAAAVPPLPARKMAQVRAALAAKLDSGAVD